MSDSTPACLASAESQSVLPAEAVLRAELRQRMHARQLLKSYAPCSESWQAPHLPPVHTHLGDGQFCSPHQPTKLLHFAMQRLPSQMQPSLSPNSWQPADVS